MSQEQTSPHSASKSRKMAAPRSVIGRKSGQIRLWIARTTAALALAVFATGLPLPAQAQETYPLEKLQAFVVAAKKVEDLVNKWQPILDAANSEAEKKQLGLSADTEILAAIEKTEGMTVAEYRAILSAARSDRTLSQNIRKVYEATGSN